MQTGVADNAVRKLLHLRIEQPVPFLHVVEQSGEIRAADLLEAHFVRNADEALAIHADLQARRLPDMYMGIDNHDGKSAAPCMRLSSSAAQNSRSSGKATPTTARTSPFSSKTGKA